MKLDDFNLNSREADALLSYSENGTFPHTLLVEGGTLEDRLKLARFIANMLLCQSSARKPCGVCSACIKCQSGNNPDVKQFGEEKENYTFKVELSRQIKQDAFVIPNDSDKKVYIITETQNMNEASENAMLKILEEPPHFDYFILTCNSKNAMLDTIISRSTVISLSQQDENFSDEAVEAAEKIAVSLCADSELELLKELSVLSAKKDMFLDSTSVLMRIFTDALIFKQAQQLNSNYCNTVRVLCDKLSAGKLYSLVNEVGELQALFNRNANYNLLITTASVRLRAAAGK